MHYRERQVEKVVAAWDNQHGTLKGYNGTIDPETPAGRVVQLLHDLCKARPHTTASNTARYQALDAISANLREHGLDPTDGDYTTGITDAVRLALADREEMFETANELRRKLDAHHRHDETSGARNTDAERDCEEIGAVMAAYDRGDEIGALSVTAGSSAERIVVALCSERIARVEAERKLEARHRNDETRGATDTDAVRKAAAARIRAAADEYATEAEENPGNRDLAEASAYYAGMSAAASIAEDAETAPESDDPFMPAAEARQHAHTIKVALDMYDKGTDPLASLTLHHPLDLSGRVAALASHALQLGKHDATDIDKGGAMYYAGMRDAAALAPEETIQAVKQAAAARIREAADLAEQAAALTPSDDGVDAYTADAFISGLRAAANLAEDIEPAPDATVAHIDTVNGRADYTPGPFAEAILATGGTIVVDDQGDPHVTDIPLGGPTGPGTLTTADGKRYRFVRGTASPVDDHIIGGGGGGTMNPDITVIAVAGGYGTANTGRITETDDEAENTEGDDDE